MEIMPKAVKKPLTIYEVRGIAGDYQLFLPSKPGVDWIELTQRLPIEFNKLEGKNVENFRHKATISRGGYLLTLDNLMVIKNYVND